MFYCLGKTQENLGDALYVQGLRPLVLVSLSGAGNQTRDLTLCSQAVY